MKTLISLQKIQKLLGYLSKRIYVKVRKIVQKNQTI